MDWLQTLFAAGWQAVAGSILLKQHVGISGYAARYCRAHTHIHTRVQEMEDGHCARLPTIGQLGQDRA